jgi:hypothetical protein
MAGRGVERYHAPGPTQVRDLKLQVKRLKGETGLLGGQVAQLKVRIKQLDTDVATALASERYARQALEDLSKKQSRNAGV